MKIGKNFFVVRKFKNKNKSSEWKSKQLTRKRRKRNDRSLIVTSFIKFIFLNFFYQIQLFISFIKTNIENILF